MAGLQFRISFQIVRFPDFATVLSQGIFIVIVIVVIAVVIVTNIKEISSSSFKLVLLLWDFKTSVPTFSGTLHLQVKSRILFFSPSVQAVILCLMHQPLPVKSIRSSWSTIQNVFLVYLGSKISPVHNLTQKNRNTKINNKFLKGSEGNESNRKICLVSTSEIKAEKQKQKES